MKDILKTSPPEMIALLVICLVFIALALFLR